MHSTAAKPRLFVAVPLPQPIRSELKRHMGELQKSFAFQKWVHPEDLHITLKFLGETAQSDAEQVHAALERVASRHKSFRLSVQDTGTFGKPSVPSILWMGLQGELPLLASIQADVEKALEPLGFPKEDRPFRPHLTIARRYNGAVPFTEDQLRQAPAFPPSEWTADRIVLYRSHLNRQPMYEAWKSYALTGEGFEHDAAAK